MRGYSKSTLITLLRIPYLGRIGSTKLVLPKWHKYGILDRIIRVVLDKSQPSPYVPPGLLKGLDRHTLC